MKKLKAAEGHQATFDGFSARLPQAKPHLFTLADQLVAAAPETSWDVILCDDIGGRLPTYFMRRVLAESNHKVPTWYIAGSKRYREKFGPTAYEDYLESIATHLGKSSLSILLTTEITSSGDSLRYLVDKVASSGASSVQTASVVNKFPEQMRTTYAGAEGRQAANDIYAAFEASPPNTWKGKAGELVKRHIPEPVSVRIPGFLKKTGEQVGSPLLGLAVADYSSIPVSSVYAAAPYRREAYGEMDMLVEEYLQSRPSSSELTEGLAA
jgi:hypoxanthine phosphoribosyltransferase